MKKLFAFPFLLALLAPSQCLASKSAEPISGDISLADTELQWGDSVQFDASYQGNLSKYQTVYITVVCAQSTGVEYQYSSHNLDFSFPLVDQVGDGLQVIYSEPGDCSATLVLRYVKGTNISYTYLDVVDFTVEAV